MDFLGGNLEVGDDILKPLVELQIVQPCRRYNTSLRQIQRLREERRGEENVIIARRQEMKFLANITYIPAGACKNSKHQLYNSL